MKPTEDQAIQFAIMLQAGLPASDAILYFTTEDEPSVLADLLQEWTRSAALKRAMLKLLGKPWQDMSLDERCKNALDFAYAGMAYYLFSRNYSEMGPADKAKYDTARLALEARAAGTAGKGDALSMFFDDLKAGKLKLSKPVNVGTLPA